MIQLLLGSNRSRQCSVWTRTSLLHTKIFLRNKPASVIAVGRGGEEEEGQEAVFVVKVVVDSSISWFDIDDEDDDNSPSVETGIRLMPTADMLWQLLLSVMSDG